MRKSASASARVLSVVGIVAALMFGASVGWAQDKSGNLKQQLVGSWSLQSLVIEQDGKKVEPYGPNPKGMLIINGDGHFMLMNSKPDLPKIASNNRDKQSTQEAQAISQGILAYFGSYTVNEKDHTITVKIGASSYPNWNGIEQKRTFSVNKDELTWTNRTTPTGGGTATVKWTRAK